MSLLKAFSALHSTAEGKASLNDENIEFVLAVIAEDATDGSELYADYKQLEVLSIKG